MNDIRIGVVGAGVMGANHARVARQLRGAQLCAVVDQSLERASRVGGDVETSAHIRDIAGELDLAVVAVPTSRHLETALELIDRGTNVLVEKPIAASVAEADQLIHAARQAGVILAVGHIERFNAAVGELHHLLDEPIHIRAIRVSPYSPRISDGVIHDLMIHDLDIVLGLFGDGVDVLDVTGVGRAIHGTAEDLAAVSLTMSNGVTASFETSRLGQQKVRQIEITQRESVIVADLVRQDVTVHKMSRHEYLADDGVRYRQSSVIEIPFIEHRGEPLLRELQDVVDSIANGRPPLVDGHSGRRALDLADRASAAISRS
jgi:predicted dehydrogenase